MVDITHYLGNIALFYSGVAMVTGNTITKLITRLKNFTS